MLSVKKKKNLKIGIFFGIWVIFELIHRYLSRSNVLIKNYGISFGINGIFFIFLSIFFVFLTTLFLIKRQDWSLFFLVVGGWINLIDRIRLGYINDYWKFGNLYNNLADWLIALGVILVIKNILWKKK